MVPSGRSCAGQGFKPYRTREVGVGRFTRQPGQVRKEAALTGPSGSSSSLLPRSASRLVDVHRLIASLLTNAPSAREASEMQRVARQ